MKVLYDIFSFYHDEIRDIADFIKNVISPILIEKIDPTKIAYDDYFIEITFIYLFNLTISYKMKI